MSSDGEGAKEKTKEEAIDQEVDQIMDVLATKGDITQALGDLLNDKSKIASDGDLLNQLMIEILFTKFGTNFLEHVQRGTEKVKPVLVARFKDND